MRFKLIVAALLATAPLYPAQAQTAEALALKRQIDNNQVRLSAAIKPVSRLDARGFQHVAYVRVLQ